MILPAIKRYQHIQTSLFCFFCDDLLAEDAARLAFGQHVARESGKKDVVIATMKRQ